MYSFTTCALGMIRFTPSSPSLTVIAWARAAQVQSPRVSLPSIGNRVVGSLTFSSAYTRASVSDDGGGAGKAAVK